MPRERRTTLSIEGERFFIDGHPTYAGRKYEGYENRRLVDELPHGARNL